MKILTGSNYSLSRLLGIAHESYANECEAKGLPLEEFVSSVSKYNCTLIQHPETKAYALKFEDCCICYLTEVHVE